MLGRNGLTVVDKAKIISERTGIPFDKVREIQKKDICDCTIEELKIRYNNPDLGKLPEWINYDLVDNIIWKSVNSSWNGKLEPLYSKWDIHNSCWEKLLLKSYEITQIDKDDYPKYIKKLVMWHISNFYYYYKVHSKKVSFTTKVDDEIDMTIIQDCNFTESVEKIESIVHIKNQNDDTLSKDIKVSSDVSIINDFVGSSNLSNNAKYYETSSNELEEIDIVNTIKSIDDTLLKDLISITAYLVAGLDCFEELYNNAIERLTDDKKKSILDMIGVSNGMVKHTNKITFKNIVDLLAEDNSLLYSKKAKKYIKDYILI